MRWLDGGGGTRCVGASGWGYVKSGRSSVGAGVLVTGDTCKRVNIVLISRLVMLVES